MINIVGEFKASEQEALDDLSQILEKISSRFTKNFLNVIEINENLFQINVEFSEPKNKLPIPQQSVSIYFRIPKSLEKSEYSFQIEKESVFYPLFNSLNLNYFESVLDRVILNKLTMSRKLKLQTNFESTRLISMTGENLKLYTIEDEENIFLNNEGEYFNSDDFEFKLLHVDKIDEYIKILWKTLNLNLNLINETTLQNISECNNCSEGSSCLNYKLALSISIDDFKNLFSYGKLNYSEDNMLRLWKYSDKNKKRNLSYMEFFLFAQDFIQCLRAYNIAIYKFNNKSFFENKIKSCVEIMNLHFKEYDHNKNEEISFDNFKKCLLKENELFTKKEIEIILKQVNPEKNFEYWKFEKILRILFLQNFDYYTLIKEDKIYKYLIKIFSKYDPDMNGKIHYTKMKHAFLTESKLKLNKIQIVVILNFFDINNQPEVDYYKASLVMRDIIQELFSAEMVMQKVELTHSKYHTFKNFVDSYDDNLKRIKDIFLMFDLDCDHILDKKEFDDFLNWLIPFLDEDSKKEIFELTDSNKDKKISFPEFKENFDRLMRITRIKNVLKDISYII